VRTNRKLWALLIAAVTALATFTGTGDADAAAGPPLNGVLHLLPALGHDIEIDNARGVLYVSLPDAWEIRTLSLATGETVGSTRVPGVPYGIGLSIDGMTLYAALGGAGSVAVIDLATGDVTEIDVLDKLGDDRTFDVLQPRVGDLLVTADRGYIVLVDLDNGNTQQRVADGRTHSFPLLLARGDFVYVAGDASPNSLYRLNPNRGYEEMAEDDHGSLAVGATRAMALPATGPPHIALASGQILDGRTVSELTTVEHGIPAYDASGKWLYTARLTTTGTKYASVMIHTIRRSDFSLIRTRTLGCPMVVDSRFPPHGRNSLQLRALPDKAGFVALNERSLCITGAQATATCGGAPITIIGSDIADTIWGTPRRDVIAGGGGNDQIQSGGGSDLVCGGPGNDTLTGGPGDDQLIGGPGSDTVKYTSAPAAVTVDLGAGTATGHGTDLVKSVENTIGSRYDDTLTGSRARNSLKGGDGSDTLNGRGGDDLLHGGPGDDELLGGPGDDYLAGSSGDDFLAGGSGDDTHVGGSGFDVASFTGSPRRVIANLSTGTATGEGNDTLNTIDDLIGSRYDDVLTGDSGRNYLIGGKGDDTLAGGDGRDLLVGGNGSDHYDGGRGSDWASFENAPKGVIVDLAAGTAKREGSDTLTSIENVFGSAYRDIIDGDREANILAGLEGNDRIRGGDGSDTLYGGEGDDELLGGAGDDYSMYLFAPGPVTVNLHAGTAVGDGSDSLTGIEHAEGSDFDDVLRGAAGPNALWGHDGDDRLYGRGGDDYLDGMAGTDTLDGGPGHDRCLNGEQVPQCEATHDTPPTPLTDTNGSLRGLDLDAVLDRVVYLLGKLDS